MNTKTKARIGTTCIFASGFCAGNAFAVRTMRKRFNKMQPLVASSLTNILVKFQEDNMTYDEIREYAATELNFIKIVTKRGNNVESN